MSAPEFLAVGHVTHDLYPSGPLPGGSAYYAGLTAHVLGRRTTLWTSHGPDFRNPESLAGVQLEVRPALHTTTFENRYEDGRRTQRVGSVASRLDAAGLPRRLLRAPLVYLCPVIDEVDLALAASFSGALVGIGVQGWVRRRREDGLVEPRRWEPLERWLRHVDLAVLSEAEADLQGDLVDRLRAAVPLVALTFSSRGSTLFIDGRPHHVEAYPAQEVDPTGAGDVYSAALLLRLGAGDTPLQAARFASAAGAAIVEGKGASAIAHLSTLEL